MSLPRDKIKIFTTYRNGNVTRRVIGFPDGGRQVQFAASNGRDGIVSLSSFCHWAKEEVGESTTCRWEYDDTHDKYDGSCGAAIILLEGTPKDNEYNYCPKCGKNIEVTQ